MPEVTWSRVVTLFEAARELPVHEREAFVQTACAGDEALWHEVTSLLAASDAEETAPSAVPEEDVSGDVAGRRYGAWESVRLLGMGGMGSVLLVRRADGEFDQLGALKLVAPHLVGRYFEERLRAERQILAHLNHPNITKLMDGGVQDGAPYLVMEYVDGVPLGEYADSKRLTTRQRLELFLKVCAPVEFAHRNLIVHRDLKPSNILVAADGEPKLLDFGTARLLPTAGEEQTRTLHRFVTPRYASPESLTQGPVTTGMDIFSLGVVLHELVTGVWPFGELDTTGALPVTYELVPASSRVTEEIADRRGASVVSLRRELGSDLGAILEKAVQPDVARRYGSVQELAGDVAAYLEGRPVSARRATAWYALVRFARRNWKPVAAGGVVIAALAVTGGIAVWQGRQAQQRYDDLRSLTHSLLLDLNKAIQDIPGSTESQKLLVSRLLPILDKMSAQSAGDLEVRKDLAEAYRELGDLQGNPYSQNLGDLAGGLQTLEKARQLSAAAVANQPPDAGWWKLHAAIQQTRGETLFASGSTSEGLRALEDAAAAWQRIVTLKQGRLASVDWSEQASLQGVIGDAYGQPGTASLRKMAEAAKAYAQALEFHRRALEADPASSRARRGLVIASMKLGDVELYRDAARARELYAAALVAADAVSFPGKERVQTYLWRKSGEAAWWTGALEEARAKYTQAIEGCEKLVATDATDRRAQFDLAAAVEGLARIEADAGHFAEAVRRYERVTGILAQLLAARPEDRTTRFNLLAQQCGLAVAQAKLGRDPAAMAERALRGLDELASRPDASMQELEQTAKYWAQVLPERLRQPAKAVEYARRYQQRAGDQDTWAWHVLGQAQLAAGDRAGARESGRRGLALLGPGRSYLRTQFESWGAGK